MTTTVKKEDQDFIVKFLSVYQGLNEDSSNLVLAFVQGMEFQRSLEQGGITASKSRPTA